MKRTQSRIEKHGEYGTCEVAGWRYETDSVWQVKAWADNRDVRRKPIKSCPAYLNRTQPATLSRKLALFDRKMGKRTCYGSFRAGISSRAPVWPPHLTLSYIAGARPPVSYRLERSKTERFRYAPYRSGPHRRMRHLTISPDDSGRSSGYSKVNRERRFGLWI